MALRFDDFTLDQETGELRKGGELIKLKPQAAQVLELLVSRAGKVVQRDEIQKALWPGETCVDFDIGINSCIRQIRIALGDDAQRPRYIQTLSKRGYRLLAVETSNELDSARSANRSHNRLIGKPGGGGSRMPVLAASVVGAFALLALFLFRGTGPSVPQDPRQPRFQLTLPRGVTLPGLQSSASSVAVSPDGQRVAFVGVGTGGRALYLRDRHELDARLLPATDGAMCPFFSPDGRWVGFGASGKLKKVALDGGAIVTLADAPQFRGASWSEDGWIVFSSGARGLIQVSADGGEVRELTRPGPSREYDHRWPHVLPGGRAALFVIQTATFGQEIAGLDLATGRTTSLVKNASYPRFVPSGHLIYARAGVLYAAAFRPESLELVGPELPVLEGVAMTGSPGGTGAASGRADYDVASEGSLVFSPREARFPRRTLVWLDREGRMEPLDSAARAYRAPALSPDEGRLAVNVEEADFRGVYILEAQRGAWTRVIVEGSVGSFAWMPDGNDLVVSNAAPHDQERMLLASVRGAFEPRILYVGEAQHPTVAPDGSAILFCNNPQSAQWDIWRLPLTGDPVAEPFLTSSHLEVLPSLSPDGHWLTYGYRSHESGPAETWIRPYPGPGPAHLVSSDTGFSPRWSRNGREIFFESKGRMMSAAVRFHPEFSVDPPRVLFTLPEDIETTWRFFDVTADGSRFLMVRKDPFELRPLELAIVPNWFAELEARLARN